MKRIIKFGVATLFLAVTLSIFWLINENNKEIKNHEDDEKYADRKSMLTEDNSKYTIMGIIGAGVTLISFVSAFRKESK